jgi:hypothetical protein
VPKRSKRWTSIGRADIRLGSNDARKKKDRLTAVSSKPDKVLCLAGWASGKALPLSASGELSQSCQGRRRVAMSASGGKKFVCGAHPRIFAAFSFITKYDNPTPRHDAVPSVRKSLSRAWRPGGPNLRNLDRSRECQQRDGQKPESAGIAETKCHAGRQKDQKMLEIMSGAGYQPGRRRTKRQDDNGQGEQPGRNLKQSLHFMAGEHVQTRSRCTERFLLRQMDRGRKPWPLQR